MSTSDVESVKSEEENVTPVDDSPETDDAKAKEMVAYALGGVAGQIANSDMLLKQNLLMFVLRLDPMLIAFLGVFGTVWDAITDPIMANISDNAKTRWGRRRPFILIGGLLATIFSVVIWANFPKNDKIVKNIKPFPEVVQSQDAMSKFGQMLKGYGISQTKLSFQTDDSFVRDTETVANNMDDLLKNSLGHLSAGVSLVEDDPSALPITLTTEGFGLDRLDPDPLGQSVSVRLTLGDRVVVNNRLTIEDDYPQKRRFRERSGDLFKGRTHYVGFSFDGEEIDFKHNSYYKKALYRARIAVLEKSIIEALGEYYNLPYWKCFPAKSDDGKSVLRENLILSGLSAQDPQGLVATDGAVYEPIVNQLLSSIEKRRKYNTLQTALKTKAMDEDAKALLAVFQENPEELDRIQNGLLDGKLSKKDAALMNRTVLKNTPAEIAELRRQLADDPQDRPYQDYTALHAKFLLFGLGYSIDMLQPEFSASDQLAVRDLMDHEQLPDLQALYRFLWRQHDNLIASTQDKQEIGTLGLLNYLQANERLGRFLNPSIRGEKPKLKDNFKNGLRAFGTNPQDDKIAIYMIVALIIMATFGTIRSVPYYALGIELAPSYNGRTKVIAIRSVMSKVVSLMNPWLFPLVLLPIFTDAIDGAMWIGIVCGIISIPLLVYSVRTVKERTVLGKERKKTPLFKSIKQTLSVPEFWRVFALFFILQGSLGLIMMATGYLILYWVFDGALLVGASYIALVQTLGYFLALLAVPLVTWICNKFQKHNALRFTVIMLALNACASWFCYNPEHPYYMFILPFFGSIGITSMYTVMGTLMADVTDADELRNGTRREGMFGAVNAMMIKAMAPIGAIMASLVIILSGFDVDLGAHQAAGTFTTMRICLVACPLIYLSIAMILLHKYPLSRARMFEIKAELKHRHERIAREEAATEE